MNKTMLMLHLIAALVQKSSGESFHLPNLFEEMEREDVPDRVRSVTPRPCQHRPFHPYRKPGPVCRRRFR